MQKRIPRAKAPVKLQRRLERALVVAIDQGLRECLGAMTPRGYVELRTMSQFVLGLRFKAALRDELYERRREKGRRIPTKF
ncbi:hypothetical protein DO72_862 [Burkholderia pseudomallei]|nr:hypothetical protein DO72_862 [Burkholderia pseudomallei]